jgi:DNA-directed RNA polymerase specialized sigma24 family protein
MSVSSAEIAETLGVNRRTVQHWCADIIRSSGPVPTPAVPTERIVELRDRDSLPWSQIATLTALSETGVKSRYRKAKGLPRYPDRKQPEDAGETAPPR